MIWNDAYVKLPKQPVPVLFTLTGHALPFVGTYSDTKGFEAPTDHLSYDCYAESCQCRGIMAMFEQKDVTKWAYLTGIDTNGH